MILIKQFDNFDIEENDFYEMSTCQYIYGKNIGGVNTIINVTNKIN